MLSLKEIVKNYKAGDTTVTALKGVSLEFRKSEFVSILGPSGCGKTTLLNIIGGLDRYDSGDLSVSGKSTKDFTDNEWDFYRNNSIGFVFQSYNLIPHQSVLANVELALTLSGVSKRERKRRAVEALTRVGLADHIKKRPNQLSGGQMQRVAIARALVNNPEILLADEPTGALDSETSVQIMNILKEISKDKLIIMVTHNPELAAQYSTRIIKLLDGCVVDDSCPYTAAEATAEKVVDKKQKRAEKKADKHKKMSFFTALSLSRNNLLTKKGRTFMTSFAGSIGIIGIALILALSNGIQTYINRVQEDTLSSYPISITKETTDLSSLASAMQEGKEEENKELEERDPDRVYSSTVMADMMNVMLAEKQSNDLEEFKSFIESDESGMSDYVSALQYGYDMDINIFAADTSEKIVQVNPSSVIETIYGDFSSYMQYSFNVWEELLGDSELLGSQYDVIAGRWPQNYNEVVLIVDEKNQISDLVMYALGLKDTDELTAMMQAASKGEVYETEQQSYSFDEILDMKFKLVLSCDMYEKNSDGTWTDKSDSENYMRKLINNGTDIKITGIIRPNEDAVSTAMSGAIGYTSSLTEYVIEQTNKSAIVKQQLANKNTDVFTGAKFGSGSQYVKDITIDDVYAYIATLDEQAQAQMQGYLQNMTEEEIVAAFSEQLAPKSTDSTYDENLKLLGVCDLNNPSTINIYASTFEDKDAIAQIIEDYNTQKTNEDREDLVINYTDYVALIMSSVSTIINFISYGLIAFVSISLVVSSIMIGIITYISVLERTKEIGILRSIGASKKDISRVFNAETLIVGFISGVLGIGITLLLSLPINLILEHLTGVADIALLPTSGAIALVIISMTLTLIAGLIPSRVAANKNPVEALRTE